MKRDNMPTFALLCFLLWMLPADSMVIRRSNVSLRNLKRDILMGMEENSVDDMYEGCTAKMMDKIKNTFIQKEIQGNVAQTWIKCKERFENKQDNTGLTMEHMQAICLYTSYIVHQEFNDAVQTSRAKYSTPSFKFYSLHFLLTDAIRILKTGQEDCKTTYRRTKNTFTATANQIIRFGIFASTSLKTDLNHFGSETCFEIRTCFGAYVKNYSKLQHEEEVLIPPYEKFLIIKKTMGAPNIPGLEDCKVFYKLESKEFQSNLNCHAADM